MENQQTQINPLLPDERIVELFWDRDETAIVQTDRKYRGYLYTIAFNILYSHESSEECLNDTYLKVWNCIPPTMPKVLRAFLAKIMRNTAIDRYDEDTRQKRVPVGLCESLEDFEGFLPDSRTIEDQLEAKLIGKIITEYLDGVSDRKLYIFMSRYYFMIPIGEIAKKLRVSESTVNKELAQMKKDLRLRLLKGGIGL